MKQPRVVITFLIVLSTFATRVSAQTRADSIAIVRIISARAVQDARRQDPDIRALSFVPTSTGWPRDSIGAGAGLMKVGLGPELESRSTTPICPWYEGGAPNESLELVLLDPVVRPNSAAMQVALKCSPGPAARRAFAWLFSYELKRINGKWVITSVEEVEIT